MPDAMHTPITHEKAATSPEGDDLTVQDRPQGLDEKHREGRTAWLQVLGGFCLNVNTWGLLGSFGAFQTYYSLKMLHGSSDSAISWIGSVQGFFMFLVSFLIGPIFDAGYLHPLLWIGTTLSVFGFFMTSLCKTYYQLFLAQGVAMGIGFGCLYLPAPALVSMHFRRHQALAMGLSSSGSGIGAVIFPLVFTRLEPRIGFPWATRTLAFILLATSILPLAVLQFPKAADPDESVTATRLEEQTRSPIRPTASVSKLVGRWGQGLVDSSALRDVPFLTLVAGLLTTFMGIYTMLYYANLLALDRTSAAATLSAQTLTIINGASTIGRILPSALADHIGPTHVLGLTALLSGILVYVSLALDNAVGLVLWSVFFGSLAGAFMGLPAAGVVSVSSSREKIGARLGMTLGTVGVGVLVAEPIAGALLGGRRTGWLGLVLWSGSLMMFGCFFMIVARISKVGMRIHRVV